MTNGINYHLYSSRFGNNVPFRADETSKIPIITKPIDKVEQIANTVDEFVSTTQDEEKKKNRKKIIRVGSIVLVLSMFGLILNPKISSSLVNKLKTKSTKAANNAKVDNSLLGVWNKIKEKTLTGLTNAIQVLNNLNSFKDTAFQKLCSKTSVTKKAHGSITNGFDKISRHTVFSNYGNAYKKMNKLDEIMNHYKNRLSLSDQKLLEEKLREIDEIQKFFDKENIAARLNKQNEVMENLEKDVWNKMKSYKDGFFDKTKSKAKHSKDVYTFWAEDILMPERNRLEEEGRQVVDSLVGDGKTIKGKYQEVIDLLAPKLQPEEKSAFEDMVKKAGKTIRSANKSECIEYFDKKRDLMLGSAPTDVVTALASLGACAVAIGAADTKEDRISRAITGAFPVIAGLGVSTALTAMLFSGGKGMALGTCFSMLLSGIGNGINRIFFPKQKMTDSVMAENASKTAKSVKIA